MSESVSTKIFISRSCRWRKQTPPMIHLTGGFCKNKILPYLEKLFVCKRHNSLKYDDTGTVHVFLHEEENKVSGAFIGLV